MIFLRFSSILFWIRIQIRFRNRNFNAFGLRFRFRSAKKLRFRFRFHNTGLIIFLQVVLLDPVPGLHMYKLAQQEEERNLFTDFGPHCRALSARLDNFFLSLLPVDRYLQRETVSSFHIDADPKSGLQWIRILIGSVSRRGKMTHKKRKSK